MTPFHKGGPGVMAASSYIGSGSLPSLKGALGYQRSKRHYWSARDSRIMSVPHHRYTYGQGSVPTTRLVDRSTCLTVTDFRTLHGHAVPKLWPMWIEVLTTGRHRHGYSPRLSAPLGMITSAYFLVCGERYLQRVNRGIREET